MFGNTSSKKEQPSKKSAATAPAASATASNSIVSGTQVEGKIKASNDIRIDGVLIGKLDCNGKVIIGPTGKVDGEINCENALIEGQFDGNLVVKELLSVKDTAKITGEIITDKLVVQSGAVFNVNCQMGGQMLSKMPSSGIDKSQQLKKDLVLNA